MGKRGGEERGGKMGKRGGEEGGGKMGKREEERWGRRGEGRARTLYNIFFVLSEIFQIKISLIIG